MRAHIGYSFGAVREARADRGARDVASRADPRPLRTPAQKWLPDNPPPRGPILSFAPARAHLPAPLRPVPPA